MYAIRTELMIYIILFFMSAVISAQVSLETSVQSSSGGVVESDNYTHIGVMGQPSPVGWSDDITFISGFIPGLLVAGAADIQSPTIDHTPVATHPINQAIDITAAASDLSGIERFFLYFRRAGEPSGLDSAGFTGTQGDQQAQIPAGYAVQQGVEYYLAARDSAGNTARLPSNLFYSIQIQFTGETYAEKSEAQHSGSKASDYRIFSIPFVLSDRTPASVLAHTDNFGAYDPANWRFFAVNNEELLDYEQIKGDPVLNPGRGFLLITSLSGVRVRVRNGHSPRIEDFTRLPLAQGWNLVGNPFDFNIPVNNLQLSSGASLTAWELGDDLWGNTPATMNRWGGLAIYVAQADTLLIEPLTGVGKVIAFSDRFSESSWGMRLKAESKSGRDLCNYIGISGGEEKEEWMEPPQIEDAICLYLEAVKGDGLKKGNSDKGKKLAISLEPAGEAGNMWDFVLSGVRGEEEASLSLEKYGEISAEYEQYLLDHDWKLAHELSTLDDPFRVKLVSGGERRFRLLVGTKEFIKANSAGIAVYPTEYELRQNFPNPFNPNTTIIFALPRKAQVSLEVFNILGQKVRTLLNKEERKEGYHVMEWDSRNDHGVRVASGMYIFRFMAEGHVKFKKAMLIK
jgi:hypothetical protein